MTPNTCTTGLQETVDYAHDLSLVDNLRGARPNPALWSPAQTLAFDAGLHSGRNFALTLSDIVHFSHTRAPTWRWKAPP